VTQVGAMKGYLPDTGEGLACWLLSVLKSIFIYLSKNLAKVKAAGLESPSLEQVHLSN